MGLIDTYIQTISFKDKGHAKNLKTFACTNRLVDIVIVERKESKYINQNRK